MTREERDAADKRLEKYDDLTAAIEQIEAARDALLDLTADQVERCYLSKVEIGGYGADLKMALDRSTIKAADIREVLIGVLNMARQRAIAEQAKL